MDTTVYQPIPGNAPAQGTPAVRARSLTKLYGKGEATVRALDGVDVDFEKGAFTAIMGPSGSGKSTLMHLLAGLDTASSGQGFIGDTEITALGDNELTRLRRDRVGFVFQSFNLLPMFTAEQNITLPIELAGRKIDAETKEWLATLVQTLGLGARLTHRPSELSGGQQQRVAIARALIAKPEVVFADEPTGNLDSRSGAEVLSFLRRSVRELGRTIIMVTHDPTAAAYADRVILIADGRIAGDIDNPTPESVLAGLDALRTLESDPADALAGTTGPTAVRA
ncbi:ABC transporter ATP-binding protein [Oerskovia enterophila]|uniref:Macrolide export ATP-binding/permease protein MacB n=1 Tax=Oerskovia enterophila TaxID=43678 RepID=A0A163Q811_9CELL|nr:ABC transporter ATP-binding protein [Oerskovia enterophila]KZM33883.1 macrolide export ATP-binding/permease protein MacB [Oerskovia enterophila]OCI32545.1 macrolide export ATP-binding/permease protein MacB [Oerskovia enterophila]